MKFVLVGKTLYERGRIFFILVKIVKQNSYDVSHSLHMKRIKRKKKRSNQSLRKRKYDAWLGQMNKTSQEMVIKLGFNDLFEKAIIDFECSERP